MQYLLGIAFGLATMLGFGISDIFIVLAAKAYGSVKAAFLIYLIISVVSLVAALWLFSFSGFTLPVIALLLFTGAVSFVAFASFAKGMEVGHASIVAPIAGGWSIITIILSIWLLNERLGLLGYVEILLIILGVVLVSIKYNDLKKLRLSRIDRGAAYGVITMIGWGLYFFLAAILVFRIGWFDAAFLLNLITLAFFFLYISAKKIKLGPIGKPGYWMVLFAGLMQLAALFAYNIGVTFNFVAIISPIASASAMVPILFGILVLREKPEKTQVLGIALIILGIITLALQGY